MALRRASVTAGLVLILALFNWSVAKKEALLRDGTPLLIELAPVDPRSLIQGDYMRLEYRIARDISGHTEWPRDGQIVVTAGEDNVAIFVRRYEADTPLAAGEHLLLYRRRDRRIKIGTSIKDNVRALAPAFQPDPLHVGYRRVAHQQPRNAR